MTALELRPARVCVRRLGAFLVSLALLGLAGPGGAHAAQVTFGSSLASAPELNTAENLAYPGTVSPAIPSPQVPTGFLRTYHWAADTAIWNPGFPAPATGQAVTIRLMGCAQPGRGGPAPLTQIHFQDLSPLPGGGVRVNLTSQAFDIPVCGQNGAGPQTISSYQPINLCVAAGDYVAFNDEGGYVPYVYQSGVPYQVIRSVSGSLMDSFIRANGTNDGDTLAASDKTAMDGFAANRDEQLALQVIEGTGPDATYICPGGSAGKPAALPAIRISPQTDGVNRSGVVSVAVYCRAITGCPGTAQLTLAGSTGVYARLNFNLTGNKTDHMPLRLSSRLLAVLHRKHRLTIHLTASSGYTTVTQAIAVRIL